MEPVITMGAGTDSEDLLIPEALNAAFCPIRSDGFDFKKLLPKLYSPKYHPAKSNFCVREDDVIKSAVGIYYNTLTLFGKELKTGGIGNVAVVPDARGKGYMLDSMNLAIEDAKKNNTDLLFLDGQRQRYGYFSFFHGGTAITMALTPKSVSHTFKSGEKALSLKEVKQTDTAVLEKIFALHEKSVCKFSRPRDMLYDILTSWICSAFALYDGEEFVGYAVFNVERTNISELKLKDKKHLPGAALALSSAFGGDRKHLRFPEWETENIDFFSGFCEQLNVSYAEMAAVLNWKKVISVLLYARAQYMPLADCEATVLIHGINGDECLKISVKSNTVSVTDGESPVISLSALDATRLFFSHLPQRTPELSPAFLYNLPLPFYVYSADNV